jgi:hypothetical protein
LLPGCDADPLGAQVDELAENRELWSERGATDYAYVYRASCFCGPAAVQAVRVEVVDGAVSAVTSVETGDEVDSSVVGFGHDLTVEGLFGFVEASLSEDPALAEISYDAELGFPTEVFFDFHTNIADEERGFSAREFALSPN